jgi:hypothetical protein
VRERRIRCASKVPLVARGAAPHGATVQAPSEEAEAPSWPLPRTVALVTAASAALWLTIVELSRRLADWLDAPPTF